MLVLSMPAVMTLRPARYSMQSGSGPGQAGRLAFQREGREAAALGKWLVIRVAVAAMKQDHVAGAKRPVLFFPGDDPFLRDQRALAGVVPSRRSRQSITHASPPNCQAGTRSV